MVLKPSNFSALLAGKRRNAKMQIRPARLDDSAEICSLFCARVPVWQRLNAQGRAEDVAYERLTLYERWLHGGHWMSIETGAVFLNHLLLGAGIPLVAEDDGHVIGYAEAYESIEGEPVGTNLHLAQLIGSDNETRRALLDEVGKRAKGVKISNITMALPGNVELPEGVETTKIASVSRYSLTPRSGQVFFRVTDLTSAEPTLIQGWTMPVGRLTSARHQWETLIPRLFETIPEIAANQHARIKVSAGGFDALVYAAARLYDPRSADIAIWTPKALQSPIISAVRDWAGAEGFRSIWMLVPSSAVEALGPDAEADGYTLETHKLAW